MLYQISIWHVFAFILLLIRLSLDLASCGRVDVIILFFIAFLNAEMDRGVGLSKDLLCSFICRPRPIGVRVCVYGFVMAFITTKVLYASSQDFVSASAYHNFQNPCRLCNGSSHCRATGSNPRPPMLCMSAGQ